VSPSSIPSSRPFNYPQTGSGLHCGKVSIEALVRRFGTPLYVYSADQIAERLSLFQHALKGREHLVCYAVKANSALAILKLLADRGAGFDIVSGGELERVRAAAPEAVGRVVFSGVGKTAAEIDLALNAGILEFNVESEAELAFCAACESRCICRDSSLYLDRIEGAQVRHRYSPGLADL
jgi:diaminopimelate decarboxylase